jgi:hypothetical protein
MFFLTYLVYNLPNAVCYLVKISYPPGHFSTYENEVYIDS